MKKSVHQVEITTKRSIKMCIIDTVENQINQLQFAVQMLFLSLDSLGSLLPCTIPKENTSIVSEVLLDV